jgi:hypothetical protein
VSNIVEHYARYLERQDEKSIDDLFECTLSYDFADYEADMLEIAEMHRISATCGDGLTLLHTNGSSDGSPRRYEFGPHFARWAGHIEPFLRALYCGTCIMLCCRIGSGCSPKRLTFTEVENNKRHYDASGNLLDRWQLRELFNHVKDIHERRGKVSLSAFPDVWNMLLSNPFFNNLCEENRDRIAFFVNSDFEMLFGSEKFLFRDQMINWSSGLNFYTCEAGTKHFLPIFHNEEGCTNILNVLARRDDSDSVALGARARCKCGRHFMPMDILFHKKNTILGAAGTPVDFSPLRANLRGRYATFQIHQDENEKVKVFMTPIGVVNKRDLEFIRSFFSEFEMSMEFNRYFEVGSKRYCFWRSARVEPKEFRLS